MVKNQQTESWWHIKVDFHKKKKTVATNNTFINKKKHGYKKETLKPGTGLQSQHWEGENRIAGLSSRLVYRTSSDKEILSLKEEEGEGQDFKLKIKKTTQKLTKYARYKCRNLEWKLMRKET